MKKQFLWFVALLMLATTQLNAQLPEWALTLNTVSNITERISASAFDNSGNVYVAGTFWGTIDLDPGPGITTVTSTTHAQAFIAKYSPTGSLLWATPFGLTTHNEFPTSVAVTPTGSAVYVAGRATPTSSSNPTSFIAKFNASGTQVRYQNAIVGTSAALSFNEIVIDAQERIYVAFHQVNANFGINLNLNGNPSQSINTSNAFVGGLVSYDSNSTFRFAQLMAFNGRSDAITLDSIGRPVVGSIWVSGIDADAYNVDIKVRDNITGAAVAGVGTHMMPVNQNRLASFFKIRRCPTTGNLLIAGVFNGTVDMDFGTGVSNLTAAGTNGHTDLYLLRYTNNLNFISATRMGGTLSEDFRDLAVVGSQAMVLGRNGSNNFIVAGDTAIQNNMFIATHNAVSLAAERVVSIQGSLARESYHMSAGSNRFAISAIADSTQATDLDPGAPVLGFSTTAINRGIFALYNTCQYRVTQIPDGNVCAAGSASFQFQIAPPSFTISSYQWRRNGANITGATSPVHVIPSYSAADTGLYELQMNAGCGTYTPSFRSNFNPITFTQQPASGFVCENSNRQLSISATGTGLVYQWQRNGVNLSNNAKFQNVTTPTLTINSFAAADTGDYRCIVSSTCNPTGAASNIARLSLAASSNFLTGMYLQLLANDTIGNPDLNGVTTVRNALSMAQDRNNTANAAWSFNAATNSHISYSGVSITTPLTVSLWFKTVATSGGLISNNTSLPGGSVTGWTPIMYLHNGRLRSRLFDGTSSTTLISPNPVNDNQWHHAVLVVQGTTQRLYLDGMLVDTYNGNTISGLSTVFTAGAAYTFNWPGGTNQWQYFSGQLDEIRIYNRTMTNAEVAALYQTSTIISSTITPPPYCFGSSVTLTANSTNATATVWTRNGINLTGTTNLSNVTISPLGAADAGEYRLMATNNCGTVGSNRLVVFYQSPSITQNPPATIRSCIGDNLEISVRATSNSALSYQWQRNGVNLTDGGRFSGTNSDTLLISNALVQDSGNYTCIVSHACNNLTATSTIARIDPRRINLPTPVLSFYMNDTSTLFPGRLHGTHVNVFYDTSRFGDLRAAYRFNGTNSRVSLTTPQAISSNNLSISLWFKTSVASGGLLHFSNNTPPTTPSSYTPVIYLDNGRVRAKYWDGSATTTTISNNPLNDNQWHHILFVFSGNTQRLYVDGVLNNTYTGSSVVQNLPPIIHMGVAYNLGWVGGVGYTYLNGLMDDVHVYQSALNDADAWALYNAPIIANEVHPTTSLCIGENPVVYTIPRSNSTCTLQWFRGATQLTNLTKFPGANTANLTISNLQPADSGNYIMRMENNCAIVNSMPVPIQIIPTAFTQNLPAGNPTQFICAGRSFTLNTSIAGAVQQMQWLRNGAPIINNANYSGATTASLTISNMSAALNGAYRLRVVACPGDTLWSNLLNIEEGGGNLLQDTSIVAWFKLDNNTVNSSRRNLTITPGGTISYTFDSTGLTNAAASFAGNGNITISNQPIAVTDTAVTYSIWFRTNSSGGILGNINPSPNSGYQSLIYVGTDGKLRGKYTTSPGNQSHAGSTQLVNNNAWHHAVLVRNGNTQTMYLNGQVVYTETNPIITTQATFEIGRSFMDINTPSGGASSNMWRNFTGQLDDLRIYRRALTQQEIQDIYTAPRFTSNVTSPTSPTACEGSTFTIGTNSTVPGAIYAWHRNGVRLVNGPNISGANSNSMTITNISPADSGVYECYLLTAGRCEGGVSPSFTLSPSRKPVFTTQPTNQQNCSGQNVTFSAAATAPTSITWSWLRNNTPLSNGGNIFNATTANMTINPIGAGDTGAYYAVATTLLGCRDTSNVASLSLTSSTAITQQPQPQSVCTGQRVVFRVQTNVTAGLTYQWRKNGINITNTNRDSFVIASAAMGDTGQYTVQIVGPCGNVLSAAAQLNVQLAPAIAAMTGSLNQTLCPGRPYNIGVLLNVPASSVNIQWTKDGQNIPGATGINFNIPSVAFTDSGEYRCIVTSSCGNVQSSIARLSVINDQLTISTQLPDSSFGCGTGSRTLSITGSFPNATFTWLRNGSIVSGAPNAATYNVPANAYSNNDVYRVRINGRCDTILSSPVVMVARPATQITSLTPNTATFTRCVGQQLSFAVGANGHNLTYQWKKDGNNISGATQATFVIPSYTTADAGEYQVEVTGTCGTVNSGIINVQTAQPISVTSSPLNINTCTGNNASFSVSGQLTGATFEWRRNGVPISGAPSSASYIINSVGINDTGVYTVMVRGACDSVLANAGRLDATIRPAFVQNLPVSESLCVGATLNLGVVVSGNVQSYQWRKNGVDISGANGASYSISNITAADAGQYQVIITGDGNCGSVNSNFSNVSVNTPAAITSQPERVTVCTHPTNFTTISITASGSNLQFQWLRDGVEINNSAFVTGTTTNSLTLPNSVGLNGNYTCRVIGSCNDTVFTQPIPYTVRNSVTYTSHPQNQTVCLNGTITLSVSVEDTSLVSFTWFKDGNIVGIGRTLVINNANLNDAGSYSMRAGLCGGVFWSGTAEVNVVQSTEILAQSPTAVNGCLGGTIRLFAIPNVSNGTLEWRKNGVAIPGANQDTLIINNATANDAGAYICVLTSPCGSDSTMPITVNVNPLPQPTIVQNGNVLSTQTFSTYQWRRDNVIISGANQQSFTATQAGTYTVTVSQNGCQGTSPGFVFNPTALKETGKGIAVNLYPNPTEKRLFVELQQFNQTTIEIYSSEGKLVHREAVSDSKTIVDVSQWARGVYFVQIKQNGEAISIERFVKN